MTGRTFFSSLAIALLLAPLAGCGSRSSGPEGSAGGSGEASIGVVGSDTMVNLAQAWAEEYGKKYGNAVDVQVSGGGSGDGIAKLIDGTIDMANASREMKQEERDAASQHAGGKDVKEYTVALDALAVYVHKENPLNEITLQQLAQIYGENGTTERWSQVEGWPSNGNP